VTKPLNHDFVFVDEIVQLIRKRRQIHPPNASDAGLSSDGASQFNAADYSFQTGFDISRALRRPRRDIAKRFVNSVERAFWKRIFTDDI
jgi:hypothetical protein